MHGPQEGGGRPTRAEDLLRQKRPRRPSGRRRISGGQGGWNFEPSARCAGLNVVGTLEQRIAPLGYELLLPSPVFGEGLGVGAGQRARRIFSARNDKGAHLGALVVFLAERVGFEPTVQRSCTPDFESGSFGHSDTSPCPDPCRWMSGARWPCGMPLRGPRSLLNHRALASPSGIDACIAWPGQPVALMTPWRTSRRAVPAFGAAPRGQVAGSSSVSVRLVPPCPQTPGQRATLAEKITMAILRRLS